MAQPAISAITMAFASPTHSMNIVHHAIDKTATSINPGAKRATGLPPTPPNSLSPNLAADMRGQTSSPPPINIDQDIDLDDAVEHAYAQDQPQLAPVPLSKGALSGLETSHVITPALLASEHLPTIMVGHGPVAIRHIIGCLTQSVPGFSRIPPAKARRLVVAALEGRTGGGRDGSIEFEKVGWGRWDAHKKGECLAGRSSEAILHGKLSPPASDSGSYGPAYPASGYAAQMKETVFGDKHVFSWTGSSMPSFDEGLERMSMSEYGPDNMSLDGSESPDSASDGAGDETEDEDWAAMGADALRKASIPTAASSSIRRNYNLLCIPAPVYDRRFSNSATSSRRKSSQTVFGNSGATKPLAISNNFFSSSPNISNNVDVPMDLDQSPQEREAIQALLSMGSM